MTVNRLGANRAEVVLANGVAVLVSYHTPVAAYIPGRGYVRTAERYSRTASKHVHQWIGIETAEAVPQSELAALIGG